MDVIQIPYSPDGPQGWTISVPGNGDRRFGSRDEAMAFALTLAQKHHVFTDQPSYLSVEGGDGRWRLFTPDLAPALAERSSVRNA